MSIFKKKLTLDDILKGIDNLSEEEKAKVHAKMQDLYKAEDEREIDKIEDEKADTDTDADEKAEEVDEESEEIGKDVDEVEEEVKDDEAEETTEEAEPEIEAEEPSETEQETAEEVHEEEGEGFDSTAIARIVRETVAEEVRKALASLGKPEPEEQKPKVATSDQKAKFNRLMATYSVD